MSLSYRTGLILTLFEGYESGLLMRPEYHEIETKTTAHETETKTESKTSCETKTRNHETETIGLVYLDVCESLVYYSNVCEDEINMYTDIFVITIIYGYESQRGIDQIFRKVSK